MGLAGRRKTVPARDPVGSELRPAHHWYAELLAYDGRFDEAFVEIERARQLDPLSLIIATDRGEILYLSRDYDRAIAQVRGVLEMEPNFLQAHYILVFSLVQKGLFAEALADSRSGAARMTRPGA